MVCPKYIIFNLDADGAHSPHLYLYSADRSQRQDIYQPSMYLYFTYHTPHPPTPTPTYTFPAPTLKLLTRTLYIEVGTGPWAGRTADEWIVREEALAFANIAFARITAGGFLG